MGIRKDTVEYNAGLFATKPNATAEDLLKKMPGIQVDNSGNVTAQGETGPAGAGQREAVLQ